MPSAAHQLLTFVDTVNRRLNKLEQNPELFSKVTNDGLRYYRADRDIDGTFNPYTHASWEASATLAASGTVNWNTIFSVPKKAKSVNLVVTSDSSGGIKFYGNSASSASSILELSTSEVKQGIVPIDSTGATTWKSGTSAVTIRVVGWFA